MKICTIVVSGRRDNCEVAKAFRDAGWDVALVTDMVGATLLRRLSLPGGLKRQLVRGAEDLAGIRLAPVHGIIAEKMLRRLLRRPWSSVWSAERLGRVGAEVASRRGGLLLSYSTYAYEAFPRSRPDLRRLLFQMHPHADVCVNLIESLSGLRRGRDHNVEWEFRLPERSFQAYRDEWRRAEGILAASSYTKDTLVAAGAKAGCIEVVPYGATDHGLRASAEPEDGVVRLLFVGSLVRRKGALVLAEAARQVRGPGLEIHACGRGLAEPEVLQAFAEAGIIVHWNRPDAEVQALQARSDAFVFPSLLEGFAHVILESMLQGLPVISTERTCAPDIMVEGKHGWIVPAGEAAPLAGRLAWCAVNKRELRAMRTAVRAQALEYNWMRFRRGVVASAERLLAR